MFNFKPVLRPFFQDHPGEPVPEENFWTWWCKGRVTEAGTCTQSGWAPLHRDQPAASAHLFPLLDRQKKAKGKGKQMWDV